MLTLIVQPEMVTTIKGALKKAQSDEIGGILMAEHIGHNTFQICDITIQRRGSFAAFFRKIDDAIGLLRQFFDRTNRDYRRFNYIGEWHSHPSFPPYPSGRDDQSMRDIIHDPSVGANFVVLMIVKLSPSDDVIGTVHTYLPGGQKLASKLRLASPN